MYFDLGSIDNVENNLPSVVLYNIIDVISLVMSSDCHSHFFMELDETGTRMYTV